VFYLAAALVIIGGDVAKTLRGEDFEDDGTIARENHRKWNYMAQSDEERRKLPTSG